MRNSAILTSTPDRAPPLDFGHPPEIDSMDVSDDFKPKKKFFFWYKKKIFGLVKFFEKKNIFFANFFFFVL